MIVLILAYPMLLHWAVTGQQDVVVWAALVTPVVIMLWPSLRRRPLWAGAVAAAAGAAAVWLARTDVAVYLLFLPSVLVPLMLLVLFSRGLFPPGQAESSLPMVTRIATAIDGDLPPEVVVYTRHVTYLWVGLFALMMLADLLLALLASREIWSLFANGINYAIVGLVFLAEYLFRRRRFPYRKHLAFHDYIRRVARIDYRRLVG